MAVVLCTGELGAREPRTRRTADDEPARVAVSRARVVSIASGADKVAQAKLLVLDGPYADRQVRVTCPPRYADVLRPGDRCFARLEERGGEVWAKLLGPDRERGLACLLGLFVIVVALGMGRKGLRTLCAILFAVALVAGVLTPLAMRGWSPLLTGWIIAMIVCTAGIALIGGWNRKSAYAIGGCLVAVAVATWLPIFLSIWLSLTGLEVNFGTYFHLDTALWYSPDLARVDFFQLMLAGIILSGLGAAMDVSMTVSTAVAELAQASPGASRRRLLRAGLSVGRDILRMMAITIVLICVGSQFQTLLLYHAGGGMEGMGRLLDHGDIATEVLRIMSCGAALALAIPLTAFVAARSWSRRREA